jgi:hypothetical protein
MATSSLFYEKICLGMLTEFFAGDRIIANIR